MKRMFTVCIVCAASVAGVLTWTGSGGASVTAQAAESGLDDLARLAVSNDAAERDAAVRALREAGPEGLEALFDRYGELIEEMHPADARPYGSGRPEPKDAALWERVKTALDRVAAQKDAYAARLYWYKDLEAAKAAARTEGKPILSLRLLGNLGDEYSCANSRFFRTVLYANREVSAALRERFVLHWKSVRPVPVITVDYGDGRKLVRTITGNSIHYVLDARGRVVDGIPGLYGPKKFLEVLSAAEGAARESERLSGRARAIFLRLYHEWQIGAIATAWAEDHKKLGLEAPDVPAYGYRKFDHRKLRPFLQPFRRFTSRWAR